MMGADTLLFFEGHMDALTLYEKLEERILSEINNVRIKTQKSQISFYNRHLFACVSFMRVRKKKDCPTIALYKTGVPKVPQYKSWGSFSTPIYTKKGAVSK